ncbi:MAG: TonB-dependent receptor plug domain-containing protein [Terracidiphilus sp.]|jgi:iron complex outermembrane receptor protein/vitamin B12 transporter
MPVSVRSFSRHFLAQTTRALTCVFAILLLTAALCPAASIRGVVTDASGAKVTGANVILISDGQAVGAAVSTADGSFQILTGVQGRFFLVVSAKSFRQLETPHFYAGRLDSIERNIVLEPEWVRESIVVTATGTPTPQPQTSEATSVLGPLDLALRSDLTSALRLMPGTMVVQSGQLGAVTSLFIRGGNSDANKILLDGVDSGDLGNQFDFGPLSTTAIERAEIFRGPDSSLYGAGAGSGVVSLTTPHGTTPFPSILLQADAGSFFTSREELEVAGAYKRLDYLGAFSWLQTANDLPNDEYHVATTAANFGYQLNGTTQIRGTLHYGVDASGVPGAWDFNYVADNATQKDQDLFISASIDNQTTAAFHNTLRYGATRKREKVNQWSPSGELINNYDGFFDDAYFGQAVTITGANGYSATGQALLDSTTTNDTTLVNNRDQLTYQGDYRFTPHLAGLIGFHFENERGIEVYNSYWIDLTTPTYHIDDADSRNNYIYLAAVQGDFKRRFYYHLGGSLEHYSLFGTQTTSNAGLSYYVLRPRQGPFNGTRIFGNFGDAIQEPKLTDKVGSLYEILTNANEQAAIQEFHVTPLAAPTTRSYEAGVEQDFLGQHLVFRTSYFHNEFGKQLEPVSPSYLSLLFPNYTASELNTLKAIVDSSGAFDIMSNTQAFRAQGIETTIESGLGKSLFFRGGYTYLDAVVQHSFTSDNEFLLAGYGFTYNGIALGSSTPLVGARPFRRAPHTGFFTASYAARNLTAVFTSAFASRSDDSTYLAYSDQTGGNTLLLPNRNLDWGYAKLDLGASYKLLSWLSIYGQAENLTDNTHIAPIGYASLPFNLHAGLRIEWTKTGKQ